MRWSRNATSAPLTVCARATLSRSMASFEMRGTGLPAIRGSTIGMRLLPCRLRSKRSPDERSDIRGQPLRMSPAFRCAHAGYVLTGLDVPPHERHHALEHVAGLRQVRRVTGVPLGVDIFQRDLAAGLLVVRDETLRLVAEEIRLHVLVVVHAVAALIESARWRGEHGLAAFEREHRIALRHVGLGAPVG